MCVPEVHNDLFLASGWRNKREKHDVRIARNRPWIVIKNNNKNNADDNHYNNIIDDIVNNHNNISDANIIHGINGSSNGWGRLCVTVDVFVKLVGVV